MMHIFGTLTSERVLESVNLARVVEAVPYPAPSASGVAVGRR